MERDTTTIEIGGHTFTHYTYVTAREMNAIQKAYFTGAKIEIVGELPKINEFDPNVQFNVQVEMVKQLVTKFDDITDRGQITEKVQDLPDDVFQELSAHLDAMVSKKKK